MGFVLATFAFIMITKPPTTEHPEYYNAYIQEVPQNDLLEALTSALEAYREFFKALPSEKADYRYAAGKWTVKEVLAHVNDGERVFAYRALSFARNDQNELPGFDEEKWAPESNASERSLADILEEHEAIRRSTIALFKSFTDEMLSRSGIANGKRISVCSIGFVIAGHAQHHLKVLRERY
jgi:hypothetical protein